MQRKEKNEKKISQATGLHGPPGSKWDIGPQKATEQKKSAERGLRGVWGQAGGGGVWKELKKGFKGRGLKKQIHPESEHLGRRQKSTTLGDNDTRGAEGSESFSRRHPVGNIQKIIKTKRRRGETLNKN